MNKELTYCADKVIKEIRLLMTTIIKGKLEIEYGEEWFNILKNHMIENQNTEGNRGKYKEAIEVKTYEQLDPTVCSHVMLYDEKTKEIFNFTGGSFRAISGLREARNAIAHNRDAGTLNWQHIYMGLNALTTARKNLSKHYGNEYFNDSINMRFKDEIDEILEEVNEITTTSSSKGNSVIGEEKYNLNKGKKNKREYNKLIPIAVAVLVVIAILIMTIPKKQNANFTSNGGNVTEDNTNNVNNSSNNGDTVINKENVQNKNITLDFSENPIVQEVTNNFIITISKVEFSRNDTKVYMNYNNLYNGDVALQTVRLDVGQDSYQMDWTTGAVNLDKMLANKEGSITIKFPKVDYVEGQEIYFMGNLSHWNSLGAVEVSGNTIDVQIQ